MTLWFALMALMVFGVAWMAYPFLAAGRTENKESGAVELARQQIAELDAEIERGDIGEDEARGARAEIERRLVKHARAGELDVTETSDKARIIGLALVAGWTVVGGAVLYGVVGRPDLPSGRLVTGGGATSQVMAQASMAGSANSAMNQQSAPAQQQVGSVDDMIAGLAARLADNPDDAEGWRMLGWSYFQTENYMASSEAYAKAIELDDSDPVIFSVFGEAMVRAGGGEVTDAALDIFHKALALDPNDPRARFFQGMALEQRGDPEGAIRLWSEILDTAPSDADWAPGLRGRIEELAANIGFDVASLGLPPASLQPQSTQSVAAETSGRGPTAADVAAASQMNAEDRQAMILGMVEGLAARLEEEPNDPEGWGKLIRSYSVLNDPGAASSALERARAALGDDSEAYAQIADMAAQLGVR